MIGAPNLSNKIMLMKTENPRPMNSALPHGRGCGAKFVGQFWKMPEVGLPKQLPAPPAQSWRPDWIRETPISVTVGPVTMGGKSFFSRAGVMNERPISNNAQREAVPRIAPYPS